MVTLPAPDPSTNPDLAKIAPRRLDRGSVAAWALYDWATNAFNTLVGTFIFSVFFARGIYGDEIAGSAAWGYAMGVAGLIVAVLSPILGSIADRGGRRKPWLAVFTVLTVIGAALLWFAEPSPEFVVYALVVAVLATVAHEMATVFYNAMLPTVAPPHMIGRVSGWGWAMGYGGGLGCLVVALVLFVQTDTPFFGLLSTENAAHLRATNLLVAAWVAVFAIPLFLFSRDAPTTGTPVGRAVREGLRVLWETLKQVRRYAQIARFMVASALYRDGLSTLFMVGGLYAAGTFGMTFEQILIFAIGLNITAGLGAAGFAWLDDWIGPKRTVLLSLAGLILCGIGALVAVDWRVFLGFGLALGIFVGPAQAASRSLLARLAPKQMETEMFGLYAMTGKAIAFMGPLTFATFTDLFASQRAGMATILVFLTVGGLILLGVRDPARAPR